MSNAILRALWLGVSLLLVGCGAEPDSPEQQIRDTFDQIEMAAENRKLGALIEFVSENYQDERGRNRKDVRAMAQLQFIRNPKIHTFKVLRDLEIVSENNATATLLVAMAGRPIDNASALNGLRAELMRFDLELVNEDGWKIQAAKWQLADLSDF